MKIEKLGDECGKGLTWAKEQNEKLIKAKRYLKTQGNAHVTLKFLLTLENLYFTFSRQVHISQNSSVPDHCKTYALSYPKDKDFISKCNHEHKERCDRCDIFPNVVAEVRTC